MAQTSNAAPALSRTAARLSLHLNTGTAGLPPPLPGTQRFADLEGPQQLFYQRVSAHFLNEAFV